MAWLQFLVLQEHKQLTPVSFKKTQNSSHGWFVKFVLKDEGFFFFLEREPLIKNLLNSILVVGMD